jgi:hypothetical protein
MILSERTNHLIPEPRNRYHRHRSPTLPAQDDGPTGGRDGRSYAHGKEGAAGQQRQLKGQRDHEGHTAVPALGQWPNQGVQLTARSLRVAPASGSS